VAAASRSRLVVTEELLPIVRAARRVAQSRAARRAIAFFGGDYELLAALPPRAWPRAEAAVRAAGGRLTRVGRVERGRGAWLQTEGVLGPMPPAGWQPFGPADSPPT
jgi:thiamine-monophosphate kinase